MLSIKSKKSLLSIVSLCNRIEEKTSNITEKSFIENEDTKEIVCFNLFQIGESVKHFDKETIKKCESISLKKIEEIRIVIVSNYHEIDFHDVWLTVVENIPPLRKCCEKILQENSKK